MAEGAEALQVSPENPKLVKLAKESEGNRCIFCKKSELNELEWGVMYQLDDIVVHYFCLLFCAALNQKGQDHEGILGFLPADIKKEVKRGEKLKCKYCRSKGATLGCALAKCKCSFHFTCGVPKGTLHQFSGSFDSYCCVHKPKVTIPVPKDMWTCGICFVDVEESENPVWPPCCKNIIYHRLCMQKYASASGSYFFSCPHCKNADTFVAAMKKSGVYVPERDAQWELEPGAFAELAQTYTHCDARFCFCEHGREHEKASSRRWRMVRCDVCGSAAIHAFCGTLNDETTTWKCPSCSRVYAQGSSNIRCAIAGRSQTGTGSADDTSDIDSSSNSCDDSNVIQVAARSGLVGIERESNLYHHPREYIEVFQQALQLTTDKEGQNKESERSSQALLLFREKLKKFQLGIREEKHTSSRSTENNLTFGNANSDKHTAYKEELASLKRNKYVSSSISEQNCIAPEVNKLKGLDVSNLDLSEYRSKKLTKQVTLPDFMNSSQHEPLKHFKIPIKSKLAQSGPPDKIISQRSEAKIVNKPKTGSIANAKRSNLKGSSIKKPEDNEVTARVKEDIRKFFAAGNLQLDGVTQPNKVENRFPTVKRNLIDSTGNKRLVSSSISQSMLILDSQDDDIEIIAEVVNSASLKTPIVVVESDEDSHDHPNSLEDSPVSVVSEDDVIILSDSEDRPAATKCSESNRLQISEESGTPPCKSENDFPRIDSFYIQQFTVPHDVWYNRRLRK